MKTSIDLEKSAITVQFEDGSTQTFARPDVDLTRHKLGEKFVYRVTDTVAIWLEKPE